MALDPRMVSLQRGSTAAALAQMDLSARWRPVDSPQDLATWPDPLLKSMGVRPAMRPTTNADPTAKWLGSEQGRIPGGVGGGSHAIPGWALFAHDPSVGSPAPDDTQGTLSDLPWVDIYLSAGKAENLDSETESYRSCNYNDESNCSLYRLRIVPATGGVIRVERVAQAAGGYGAVQPALSPSGDRLAYVLRNSSGSSQWSYLIAEEVGVGGFRIVSYGRKESGGIINRPQFPNWYDDDALLYHTGEQGDTTLYRSTVTDDAAYTFGEAEALLGPRSGVSTTTSFADASTRQSDGASAGMRVTTFGPHGEADAAPRVHRLNPLSATSTEVETQDFSLGMNMAGTHIAECHHPTWNPGGTKVMCTAHGTDAYPLETYPVGGGPQLRFLYMYGQSASRWSGATPAFTPLTPAALATRFGALFPTGGMPQCRIYTYKYAEWCASENYIVATVFCSDDFYNRTNPAFSSRVMLIQINPLRYIDLTSIVEGATGAALGEIHGIYSTCSRPS